MARIIFESPELLAFLLVIPLLFVAHYVLYKITRKKGMIFANFDTIKRVTGKKVMTRNITVFIFRICALLALVLALASPIYLYEGQAQTSDYVLAIDVSASMTATDLTPNRLEAAKQSALQFIDGLDEEVRVGVIGFSGNVFVEQTPTTDLELARQAIERLDVVTVSGTDIASALVTGSNLLLGTENGKVIILYTDGSSTTATFNADPIEQGTRYAVDNGVVVHTVGIGQPGSTPTGYLPRLYNISAAYNEETLSYVANQTQGLTFTASNDAQLDQAYEELSSDAQSTLRQQSLQFWFMITALLFLFAEWGLTNTRYRIIP